MPRTPHAVLRREHGPSRRRDWRVQDPSLQGAYSACDAASVSSSSNAACWVSGHLREGIREASRGLLRGAAGEGLCGHLGGKQLQLAPSA
eukprot:346522-Chlamydomonas_euryale.AAC.1